MAPLTKKDMQVVEALINRRLQERFEEEIGRPRHRDKEGGKGTVWDVLDRVARNLRLLTEAQARTEESLARLTDTVGEMKGDLREIHFAKKAPAYLGRLARKVREVPLRDLEERLESRLDPEELYDLLQLDVLLCGVPRGREGEVYWAVEVSWVVDGSDVERARRRADALAKAGFPAVAAVAGGRLARNSEARARSLGVLVLENGSVRFEEEALRALSAEPSDGPPE